MMADHASDPGTGLGPGASRSSAYQPWQTV